MVWIKSIQFMWPVKQDSNYKNSLLQLTALIMVDCDFHHSSKRAKKEKPYSPQGMFHKSMTVTIPHFENHCFKYMPSYITLLWSIWKRLLIYATVLFFPPLSFFLHPSDANPAKATATASSSQTPTVQNGSSLSLLGAYSDSDESNSD